MTTDRGAPDPESPSVWNRYSYSADDPANFNDSDGMLPANVSYGEDNFACVQDGSFVPGGSIDASNPCPPGFTISIGGYGGSKSLTRQVFEIFSPLNGLIEDWDYANAAGTAFNITLSAEMFNDFTQSGTLIMQAPGVWTLGGVLIRISVTAGAIITSPVTLTVVGVAAVATVGALIYMAGQDLKQVRAAARQVARELAACA